MTDLREEIADLQKKLADIDPRCAKCGHKRSEHHYRHPFVGPSQQDTIADLQKKLVEVEAELDLMKTAGIIEVAIRNPSVSEYMQHWERRAEAAEARIEELEAKQADLVRAGVLAAAGMSNVELLADSPKTIAAIVAQVMEKDNG